MSANDTCSHTLHSHYLAYDDTALKTYGNAGLLRRAKKDISADKVSLLNSDLNKDESSVTLLSDGHHVTLSVAGLTEARCDCSAVGACKHIIASVLYLQSFNVQANQQTNIRANEQTIGVNEETNKHNPSEQATNNPSNKQSITQTETDNSPALAEMIALDVSALQKIAKTIPKAKRLKAMSWALSDFMDEQQPQASATQVIIESHSIRIQLASHSEEIRYIAGAGFKGMLSKIERDQDSLHFLALLSVIKRYSDKEQRHQVTQWLSKSLNQSPKQTANNLFQLSYESQQILDDLSFDIRQVMNQGLSQVDSYSANRMHLANVLARSQYLPRLATMLRQLSGQMYDFINADSQVNEGHILQRLAELAMYLYQLRHATGQTLQTLRGKLRQSYDSDSQQPALTLYPLGARWWQSQGKARGLTLYFYQAEETHSTASNQANHAQSHRCIELTQARGQAQDPSFDKYSAWYQHVWLTTSDSLMQQVSTLDNPRFSESVEGSSVDNPRLAVTGSKVTNSKPINQTQADFEQYIETISPFAEEDWTVLAKRWQHQLATESRVNPIVLLNPTKVGGLLIDELAQCVWWQLEDKDSHQLRLRLDWNTSVGQSANQSIETIKKLERIDRHQIQMVVAYVKVYEQSIHVEPISLILQGSEENRLFHLDYDDVVHKKNSLKELLSGRISKLMSKKRRLVTYQETAKPLSLSERVCQPILQILQSLSATGRLRPTEQQSQQLKQQQQLANDAGLNIVAEHIETFLASYQQTKHLDQPNHPEKHQSEQPKSTATAPISALLRLVHVCHTLRLLEVDMPISQ